MTTVKTNIADMIDKLTELKSIALRASPQVAAVVKLHLQATIARGADPYGDAWAVRKDTGTRPLQHADQTLEVHALGTHIIVEIHGIDARHHHGAVKGSVKRPVIFDKRGIPSELKARVLAVLTAEFNRTMQGGG